MKVFLVNDICGEGAAYYAASTYEGACGWIKKRQIDDIARRRKWGWTESELRPSRRFFKDPKELHPYDIQEMEIDKEE